MTDAPTPRDVIAREVATTRHPTTKELMIGRGAKKRADAILSALTAAGYAVEQGWRDIATAPRDGRDVLVYGPWEGEVSAGDGTPGQYVAARMGGAYYVRGTDQYYGEVAATHWRPLGAPPETPT